MAYIITLWTVHVYMHVFKHALHVHDLNHYVLDADMHGFSFMVHVHKPRIWAVR